MDPKHGIRTRLKQRFTAVPPQVWLLLLTLACLAPFLNKAFHIDDTLFIRVAQQIQKHPADFYGFNMNWYGVTMPMVQNFDNPPLASYYIAILASIFGWNEATLHLGFILAGLAASWGVFCLARNLCTRPLFASLCAVLTPVFLVSGTTVMCDTVLLAMWVWTVVLFQRALGTDRKLLFLTSGLLAGLACWTKFTGLALAPLLAAYGLFVKRRPGWWLLTPLLPLVFAAAHEWITYALYGKGLLLTAASLSSQVRSSRGATLLPRLVVGLTFTGGCFLPLLLYAPFLWSFRDFIKGMCFVVPTLLVFPYLGQFALLWHEKRPDWLLFIQTAVFLIAGMHVLLLALNDYLARRDAEGLLLLLWVGGIFTFTTMVNWTVNARSLLPMVPAVGILIARRLEQNVPSKASPSGWRIAWPAVAACILSLAVAKADFDLANVGRASAQDVCAKYLRPGQTLWFEGHWGFQHYMEQRGGKALERGLASLRQGDYVVVPSEAISTFDLPTNVVQLLETLEYPVDTRLSTMSLSSGAGFYAAVGGPFPYSLGRVDPEQYYVFAVTQTLEEARKAPGGISKIGAVAQQFELERMAAYCQAYIRGNPDNLFAYFQLGLFLASRGKIAEAEKQFRQVLRIDPNNGPADLELATLATRQRNLVEALTHYQAAVRLMPDSDRAREGLAQLLAADKDPQSPTPNGPAVERR